MLPFGPLGRNTVHVAVDMQRLFAEPGPWQVPGLFDIAPTVAHLARARPGRTVFTRFVTPESVESAPGWWRHYYGRWADFTGSRLSAGLLDLIPDLAAIAEPAMIVDKLTHSAFESPEFIERLDRLEATTLVVSGVETDVCVLATILTAVDRGLRVVVANDALASSSTAGHTATLDHLLPRFDQQIEAAPAATIVAAWQES